MHHNTVPAHSKQAGPCPFVPPSTFPAAHHPLQVELAKRLVTNSFADKAFFCNSGTEANEGAIKFARKWARVQAGVDPYDASAEAPHELVSFTNCFHGRTMGALALTYKVRCMMAQP